MAMINQASIPEVPEPTPARTSPKLAVSKRELLPETRAGAEVSKSVCVTVGSRVTVTDSLVQLISLASHRWI